MKKYVVWLALAASITAQAARLEFEVASIKPSADAGGPGFGRGGRGRVAIQMGVADGGRFVATGLPVRALILLAYGIQDFQLSGGPGWLMEDRFDIEARPEAGFVPTEEQTREMLQALLEDRFGLKVRHETKNGPVYALTVAKGGPKPKLKLSDDQTPVPEDASDLLQGRNAMMELGMRPPGGGPRPGGGPGGPGGGGPGGGGAGAAGGRQARAQGGPGGGPGGRPPFGPLGIPMEEMKRGAIVAGPNLWRGKAVPVAQLVKPVMSELRKPVVDQTGLKGLYDIELTWTPAQLAEMAQNLPVDAPLPRGLDPNGPTMAKALQDQLGLKLDSATGPVEAIVIEKVEKPTEN